MASEYEKQRLANIAANEALLKTLDLTSAATKLTGAGSKPSSKTKPVSKPRAKPKPKEPKEPALSTRSSSRIAGIELAKEDPAEAAKRQREVRLLLLSLPRVPLRPEHRKMKHGKRRSSGSRELDTKTAT